MLTYSTNALAYVDPGIVGVMFQFLYALIFGTIFFIFARPIQYFKQLVRKFRKSPKPSTLESSSDSIEQSRDNPPVS